MDIIIDCYTTSAAVTIATRILRDRVIHVYSGDLNRIILVVLWSRAIIIAMCVLCYIVLVDTDRKMFNKTHAQRTLSCTCSARFGGGGGGRRAGFRAKSAHRDFHTLPVHCSK